MLGGHGVISVQAMAFPEIFSLMVKHSLNKNIMKQENYITNYYICGYVLH